MDSQFGFVAILDALGVRNYTIKESFDFLDARAEVVDSAILLGKAVKERINTFEQSAEGVPEPTITTFGDSVVITWNVGKPAGKFWIDIGILLNRILVHSLERNIFFRGSVSIGPFIQDGPTVLGPAVSDAADWYEEGDWIGIFLTPSSGYNFDLEVERQAKPLSPEEIPGPFVKYNAPTKSAVGQSLWVVAWPWFAYNELQKGDKESTVQKWILEQFHNATIPKGAESKYSNTVEFLRWYDDNFLDIARKAYAAKT